MGYAGFFFPKIGDVPQVGKDLMISVNFTGVDAPRLYFKRLGGNGWFECNVSLINGSCTVPKSYFSEGLFEYYFANESGSLRYPDGNSTFKIAMSSGNLVVYDKAVNLLDSGPLTRCDPWDASPDYSCDYEDRQGFMISGYSDAFFMTGNGTYGDVSDELVQSNVDPFTPFGIYDTCEHNMNDFDCDNVNGADNPSLAPSGAMRQASMIHALWNRYGIGGNSTVLDMALNYTNGSAEDCDVWNVVPDFDCGNADDQGFMIYAYFEAYEKAGDLRYRQIAQNLSAYGLSYNDSDFLMLGFFKAYELTGNETFRDKALNVSLERIDSCRYGGCDVYNQSVSAFAMWNAYEQTGDYRYKLSAYDKTMQNFSGSCNPGNDTFSCQDPREQGAMIMAFLKAYKVLDGGGEKFYSPLMSNDPKRLESVIINVSFGGILMNPVIYYRRYGMAWKSGDIAVPDMSYTIPAVDLSYVGVYEYYFYDNYSLVRFPENDGTFKFAVSDGNDTFRMAAGNFSSSDPTSNYCRPFSSDFTCNYETLQGGMILGYLNSYFSSHDSSYMEIAKSFAEDEIDSTDPFGGGIDFYATCDHTDDDFDCDTDSPIDQVPFNDIVAPLRQGWMIYSLWDAYQKTRDNNVRRLAQDYSSGSSESCDVWNAVPDYDCWDADGQGLMMLAYFKAYEQTADDAFLIVARNLSDEGISMSDSDYLAMGLFSAYDMTGNVTYLDRAMNISDSRLDYCVSSLCSAVNLSISGLAMWSAYEHTELEKYLAAAVNKTVQSPANSCDPWNATPDYRCIYPDEQGMMMSLYWKAYQAYAGSLNSTSMDVGLDVPVSVDVDGVFNASCVVMNTGSDFVFNVNVTLYFLGGFNTSDNLSYLYDNLSVLGNVTLNWTVLATESGDRALSCNVSADDYSASDFAVVTVNAPPDDEPVLPESPSSSSSSSSAVVSDSLALFYEAFYDYYDLNNSNDVFNLISGNGLLADSISSYLFQGNLTDISETSYDISDCYNVSRSFESNSSIYKVSKISLYVLYLCSNTSVDFFVYDTLPKTFAESAEDISVELSKDGDIYVVEDDPSFMFVFDNASEGEAIYINYTVNRSFTYNILDDMGRPLVFAVRFEELGDVLAPRVDILYPINDSNVSSRVFLLVVRYYDDSVVKCSYAIDGEGRGEMDDYLMSEKSVRINVSGGWHSVAVECADVFGNSNSSSVLFYVDEAAEGGFGLDDTDEFLHEGENMIGQYAVGLMFVLLGVSLMYLYVRGYVSYLLLNGLLRFMFLLDRAGSVNVSFKFYPVMLKLYESLDVSPKLKERMNLREDVSKVMPALELYAITNKTYVSAVNKDISADGLRLSLASIKSLFDRVREESLVGRMFLEQVRDKYIFCVDCLAEMMYYDSDRE